MPLCLILSPMMNVHWVLVPSGGNYSDQWPISLLITSQFQLPKFSFLNGEYVPVQFALQWSWGSGKQWSCGNHDWSCWNLCNCRGCTQGLIPGLHAIASTKLGSSNLLVYVLSCVCFTVVCKKKLECYWYSVGCGWIWGKCLSLVQAQARWILFSW